MAAQYSIEHAQVLSSLPSPFDPTTGKTRTGPVYSFKSGRRRKRLQLLVAADGNSISLYDISRARLTSSHTVPPLSTFVASPVCVYLKDPSEKVSRRLSYVALAKEDEPMQQIVCFNEELPQASSNHESAVVTSSHQLGSVDDPIIFIDVLSYGAKTEMSLVVVQKSGKTTLLSSDLSKVKCVSTTLQNALPDGHSIKCLSVDGAAVAVNGFLSERMDVLNRIGPMDNLRDAAFRKTSLILCITSPSVEGASAKSRAILFSIGPLSTMASDQIHCQRLSTWTLPGRVPIRESSFDPGCASLDPTSGYLQLLVGSSFAVLDLSEPIAREVNIVESCGFNEFVALSKSKVFTVSAAQCAIYDSKYGAALASQVTTISEDKSPTRKRKRTLEALVTGTLKAPQFFPKLRSVYGLHGSNLVGIELKLPKAPLRSTPVSGNRLIDVLGRGCDEHRRAQNTDIRDLINKLDDLSVKKDTKAFEQLYFAKVHEFGSLSIHKQSSTVLQTHDDFPVSSKTHKRNQTVTEDAQERQQMILYALGKIFTTSKRPAWVHETRPTQDHTLGIAFMPSTLFKALAAAGYLTPADIQAAQPSNDSSGLRAITWPDIIRSIAAFDRSLILLSDLTSLPKFQPSLPGVVETLKLLIASFDNDTTLRPQRLLNTPTDDATLHLEAEAAARDLDLATSILESSVSLRGRAIERCLERLAVCFPPREAARAIRTGMSRGDTLWLLELLRGELLRGGWTLRMLDLVPASDTSDGPSNAVTILCALFSAVIDALGSGAWLGGENTLERDNIKDDEARATHLVSQLRGDTSAVLEGVQESSFFEGFLRDFLRYEEMRNQSEASKRRKKQNSGVRVHDISTGSDDIGSALPLGMKAVEDIGQTKVGAGGEVTKRSRRDWAYRMSQKVPVYSLETIRV